MRKLANLGPEQAGIAPEPLSAQNTQYQYTLKTFLALLILLCLYCLGLLPLLSHPAFAQFRTAVENTTSSLPQGEVSTRMSTIYTPTSYEAEASTSILTGMAQRNTCATCSGGMDVIHIGLVSTATGHINSTITFRIPMSRAGSYTLTVYYLNGASKRMADLSINKSARQTLAFPRPGKRGDWSVVGSVKTTIYLKQGPNLLMFANPQALAPDIDRIVV